MKDNLKAAIIDEDEDGRSTSTERVSWPAFTGHGGGVAEGWN